MRLSQKDLKVIAEALSEYATARNSETLPYYHNQADEAEAARRKVQREIARRFKAKG